MWHVEQAPVVEIRNVSIGYFSLHQPIVCLQFEMHLLWRSFQAGMEWDAVTVPPCRIGRLHRRRDRAAPGTSVSTPLGNVGRWEMLPLLFPPLHAWE